MPSVIESPPDAAPPVTARHRRQAHGIPPSKNRVGDFSATSRSHAGFSVPQTLENTSQTTVTLTIIAPGRSVWPSRDLIEEIGSSTLFVRQRELDVRLYQYPLESSDSALMTETGDLDEDYNNNVIVYSFAGNDSINAVDVDGLSIWGKNPKKGKRFWSKLQPPSCSWPDCYKFCKTPCELCCGLTAGKCSGQLAVWHGAALALCTKLKNPWAIGGCLAIVTENLLFAEYQLGLENDICMLKCPRK